MNHIKKFEAIQNTNTKPDDTLDLESAFEKITLDYDVYGYVSGGQDTKLTITECLDKIKKGDEIYVALDDNKADNIIAFMEYLRFLNIRIRIDGDGYVYLYKLKSY